MKKLLSLLLALVLCLSLCACGGSAELEKYQKYETLINYLEAEEYENAYYELLRLSQGAQGTQGTEQEEKELVTVDITLDNWQEYFEIRPYEECFYNDFGDLTGQNNGYAFYLKSEHLSRLAEAGPQLPDGSVDVSFKVGLMVEYREYDQETKTFVEGGKIYSTEEEELVVKVYDYTDIPATDTNVSTGNGQVFAKMCCMSGVGADCYYEGVYTENIDVRDVTGTLVFEE